MIEGFNPKIHCENEKGSCRIEQVSIPIDEANSSIGITSSFLNTCQHCEVTWLESWIGDMRVK